MKELITIFSTKSRLVLITPCCNGGFSYSLHIFLSVSRETYKETELEQNRTEILIQETLMWVPGFVCKYICKCTCEKKPSGIKNGSNDDIFSTPAGQL